jgi:hypothetical protein
MGLSAALAVSHPRGDSEFAWDQLRLKRLAWQCSPDNLRLRDIEFARENAQASSSKAMAQSRQVACLFQGHLVLF